MKSLLFFMILFLMTVVFKQHFKNMQLQRKINNQKIISLFPIKDTVIFYCVKCGQKNTRYIIDTSENKWQK